MGALQPVLETVAILNINAYPRGEVGGQLPLQAYH